MSERKKEGNEEAAQTEAKAQQNERLTKCRRKRQMRRERRGEEGL